MGWDYLGAVIMGIVIGMTISLTLFTFYPETRNNQIEKPQITTIQPTIREFIGVKIVNPVGYNTTIGDQEEIERFQTHCNQAKECWASVTTCKGGIAEYQIIDNNTAKVKCK